MDPVDLQVMVGALRAACEEMGVVLVRSAHSERYGYDDADAELELVTVRVAAATPGAELVPAAPAPAEERGARELSFEGERVEARVFGPGELEADGPAVIELPGSTLVVPPEWRARGGGDAVVMEQDA